jgi:uncharacterized integral membrane protein
MASLQTEHLPVSPPAADYPAAPSAESQTERIVRYGHRARLYTGAVLFVALLAVLIVLIAKNTGAVRLDWAVGSTRASLVWIILATAVIGWLLGVSTAVVFHHRTRRP